MKKTLIPEIKIIDDFFEIPDLWRELGVSLNYTEINKGLFMSSSIVEINPDLFHSIAQKISKHYNHLNFSFFESKFSFSTNDCLDTQISQEDNSFDFSAVIFLNPNPPRQTGLSFYSFDNSFRKTVDIENVFNRCVIYDTKSWLSHNGCFGEEKNSGRLIIKIIGKCI